MVISICSCSSLAGLSNDLRGGIRMATVTELKCKHCGATAGKNGKAFPHKGALNLHESVHCPKKPSGGVSSSATNTCCANPSIRLLRTSVHNELYVMHQGYRKVCDNCKECS